MWESVFLWNGYFEADLRTNCMGATMLDEEEERGEDDTPEQQ